VVSYLSEIEFCKWLTTDVGVAAISLSAFYGNGFDQRVVRFCLAKKVDALNNALAGWPCCSVHLLRKMRAIFLNN
jgi:methionine aminotransferase